MSTLLGILEEIIIAFLCIWWIQSLIQERLLPARVTSQHFLGADQLLLLRAQLARCRPNDSSQRAVLLSSISPGRSSSVVSLWIRCRLLGIDDPRPCCLR